MCDLPQLRGYLEEQLPAALDLLREMVEINSFTGNREGVNRLGRLTAERFRPLGFQAEFVPSANPEWGDHLVMTRPGGSGKGLAMISHLDTVFPPEEEARNGFKWDRQGDRIFGPGTMDIKGGTVMMWLVLDALRRHAPEVFEAVTWKLFWNAAEEPLAADFAGVCRSRLDAGTLGALVFEAEDRRGNEILLVTSRKGRGAWRATATGRGAHAGSKHPHGANAIVQLAQTVQRVAALTDYPRQLTFNAGVIHGGTVANRVPHEATAEGEYRAFEPEVCAQGRQALLALAGPGAVCSPQDGFACEVKIEVLQEWNPWPPNPGTEALCRTWREAGTQLGLRVNGAARGGLSDGNRLWDVVPTLDGLGPWGDNDHSSERSADGSKLPEFVTVSSFVPKAALNAAAIVRLAESSAKAG